MHGRPLRSPMALYSQLREAGGKLITEQDDPLEVLSPQLFSRTDDPPRYRFVVPAAGDYLLMVSSRDAFTQAGPRHLYRVRLTPEQPDFRLIAMPPGVINPDSAVVGRGGHQAWTIYVWRQDGFSSDITMTAEGLPPGV